MTDVIASATDAFNELLITIDMQELQLPSYLIKLLQYNGFANIYALASFQVESDVKILENYAKSDLANLLNEEEKKEFFGIYYTNISLFKVVEGHKRLLTILVNACKLEIEKNKNKRKNNSTPRIIDRKKQRTSDIDMDNINPKSKDNEKGPQSNTSENNDIDNDRAIEHIKNIVKNYQRNFLNTLNDDNVKAINLLQLETLHVEVQNNCAMVTCTKCQFVSKAYTRIERGKSKWVLSNVNRHFKTHFKISKKQDKEIHKPKHASILSYLQPSPSSASYISTEVFNLPSTSTSKSISVNTLEMSQEAPLTLSISENESDPFLINLNPDKDFSTGRVAGEAFIRSGTPAIINDLTPEISLDVVTSKMIPKRRDRILRSRHLTFDNHQMKLTDFIERYKVIEENVCDDLELQSEFSASIKIMNESLYNDSENEPCSPSTFLELLKDAALKNAGKNNKLKCGNRYDSQYKQFCLYIFLTAGRLAYETLVANTSNALPSLTTLGRTLSLFGKVSEGDIQFQKLKEFLDKRNYPKHVFISEDQTAIIGRVRYHSSTNELVGCVPKISEKTGFPHLNQYSVDSVLDIKNAIENNNVAKNAYVYMAQPLVDGAPAFCLTIFGSANKFSSENVLCRWNYLINEAKRHGIIVDGISSDGDTRCLKAMKIFSGLPSRPEETSQDIPYFPYFQANFAIDKPIVVQDTIHISTKIKTRLLKPDIHLPVGKYVISKSHIEAILTEFPKDVHLLCSSDLDGSDKMNFSSIDKMCAPRVTNLLAHKEECKATMRILIITRYILDCFLDKSLTVERRVYLIWYATFFLRLWRAWIKENETFTLGNNWITLNTYTCVELNAHALMIIIEKCRVIKNSEILPWLYSSQPCEKFFRQTRSMTSTYATMVNYDMLDLLQRKHRIHAMNSIVSDSDKFIFPREQNNKMGVNSFNVDVTSMPSIDDLKNIIENAKLDAIAHAHDLEMELPAPLEKLALEVVSLSHVIDTGSDNYCENDESEKSKENEDSTITLNPEDLGDIEEEMNIFADLKEININDYKIKRGNLKSVNPAHLRIYVNNKEMIVKKATLCWLFSSKIGRLSSDRLLRVRGMKETSQSRQQLKTPQLKKKETRTLRKNYDKISLTHTSETSASSGSYETESEFEAELYSEDEPAEDNGNPHTTTSDKYNEIKISPECYYAVRYDTWYIGRVVSIIDSLTSKIKFLKSELDDYVWPRDDDTQIVKNEFIFYGPISLLGCGPFQLKRREKLEIERIFKLKKKC